MADRATAREADQPALGVIRALRTEPPAVEPPGRAPSRLSAPQPPAPPRPGALSARHPRLRVLDLLLAGVAQRTSTGRTITN